MKIEVKKNDPEKEYPWIGIDSDGDICIFTGENEGVWIFMDGKKPYDKMGIFDSSMHDEYDFEPFNGTITLSND